MPLVLPRAVTYVERDAGIALTEMEWRAKGVMNIKGGNDEAIVLGVYVQDCGVGDVWRDHEGVFFFRERER